MRGNRRLFDAMLLLGLLFIQGWNPAVAQGVGSENRKSIIKEKKVKIKTYPFSDPDPRSVSGAGFNKETIYPYFKYDGYSHTSEDREWTEVEMENPYIKLSVLPEVGGKVKGAIEKSTGREFIYDNDVLKFRNISLRGPWTSGGIEFNFGVLGHSPHTAEKVDYLIKKNPDGSVSCIVGTLDLASRTEWRVNIKLPPDKAYFETNSFFYNATPVNQSNYVWLTAAAKTKGDLQVIYPGNQYLGHDGKASLWPVDEQGRNLSFYKNHNFGDKKSYHVIGSNKEWLAGYWHDDDFGFGHWSRYASTPGQKIFFWSQARSGAIWEDLLTDHKGQYMEYQLGRWLAQSFISSGLNTPFNLPAIGPNIADQWQDLWFPIGKTAGVKEASRYAVLNVMQDGPKCRIIIFALADINTELLVKSGDRIIYRAPLKLLPTEIFNKELNIPEQKIYLQVKTTDGTLDYNSDADEPGINRPSGRPEGYQLPEAEKNYFDAIEYYNSRHFAQAYALLQKVLQQEPNHFNALIAQSELYYCRGQYAEGKALISRAFQNKYYDPSANYKLGILSFRLGDLKGAEVALEWAARSMEFRSAACTQIADIAMRNLDYQKAMEYAGQAIDAGKSNINAYKTKAIAQRSLNLRREAIATLDAILEIDPLNHFARFEKYLLSDNETDLKNFRDMIRNSNPAQTYLEIASYYLNLGKYNDALKVLNFSPSYPMVSYWLAFLNGEKNPAASELYLKQAIAASPRLVFPFRLEELEILEWAKLKNDGWQTKYYLALLYWHLGQFDKAERNFESCRDVPNEDVFYLNRSKFYETQYKTGREEDLLHAIEFNASEWRSYHELINLYFKANSLNKAEEISEKAAGKFRDNFIIGLDYAMALYKTGKFEKSLAVLSQLNVLPYEGADEGRKVFEKVILSLALQQFKKGDLKEALRLIDKSKEYPENLGTGTPYDPDFRLQNFLAGIIYKKQEDQNSYRQKMEDVYRYSFQQQRDDNAFHYLGAVAAKNIGQGKEGLSLLEEIATKSKNSKASWALKKFRSDEAEAEKLAQEFSGDEYFQLMLQILEL